MKALLYIAAALFLTTSYAQEVKGKISSESGPLHPASILVIEQSRTVDTDQNGNFSFKLKAGQYHLEISSENYTSKKLQ